ncbi:MAG: 5-dehydro-4-deoxy-D-glucuronate isomerase [Verrucomicrobia bacterium]|nr:5-dehydro-4-deoxy-D-glucuronate isomerase [Cytophagales bacterium]
MEIRHTVSPNEMQSFSTNAIRKNFLITTLLEAEKIHFVYSHYDRTMIGGAMPVYEKLRLPDYESLKSAFFLKRRELGIINVGGKGRIEASGHTYQLSKLDCLYVGQGTEMVSFESAEPTDPACFFMLSAPAHQPYATRLLTSHEATPVKMGAAETSNQRTIYKYIHAEGIQSCQLVMGLTVLETGSVWNTMPAHVHDRRMEAYFYFDLPEQHRVFHLMGQPEDTRHIVVGNHQAVVSPPWSIHSGCGTSNYSFVWGMAGENMDFSDMDFVDIADLQ